MDHLQKPDSKACSVAALTPIIGSPAGCKETSLVILCSIRQTKESERYKDGEVKGYYRGPTFRKTHQPLLAMLNSSKEDVYEAPQLQTSSRYISSLMEGLQSHGYFIWSPSTLAASFH